MIPKAYITEWRNKAPWQEDFQVEQDLIIERALVEIYNNPFLKERLAFRGGTALHKIHLKPQARYSEDIDLVQIKAEPFGPVIDELRNALSFLGKPAINQKKFNNTLIFRVNSEDEIPLKLKVEMNCREHIAVYGLKEEPLEVQSAWFTGKASLVTYELEELLATKLRALYQRSKGRDLFDMSYTLDLTGADPEKIITAWKIYMEHEKHTISKTDYLENLEKKMNDEEFLGDITGLLRPAIQYDHKAGYEMVKTKILELL